MTITINFLLFVSFFYFLLISTIGYGILFEKLFFKSYKSKNTNTIFLGFYGLFSLTFISIFSSFFFAHNFIHNIAIHLLGVLLFFLIKMKEKKTFLKIIFYISLILISALFISKTHDDFSYYHLPFTNYLIEQKIIFGIGNLGHGYNLLSSLFFLNSIFYLPFIENYSFHFGLLYFLIFFNYFIFQEILNKENHNITILLYLFCFVYFNLSFNRIAEYGTDKAGQLLIVILIIKLFQIFSFDKKKIQINNYLYLIPLLVLCISLKTYFLTYILLGIIVLIFNIRLVKSNNFLKIFSISLIFLFFYFIHHFVATGCFISPLSFTCFGEELNWARNPEYFKKLTHWLELWSKAGAGPNFRVEDTINYTQGFNWFSNWVEKYFLEKFLDQIGILVFTFILVILVFKKFELNFINKYYSNKIIIFYSAFLIIFLIWFLKHPQLRYGGYSAFFLLLSIPVAILFSKLDNRNFFFKRLKILIILVALIFNIKNINRIYDELNRNDHYQYTNFPFFALPDKKFIPENTNYDIIIYRTEGHCWNIPSPCIGNLKTKIEAKKYFNYYFLYR